MSIPDWIICWYALIYLGIMLFALVSYLWLGQESKKSAENFPSISILVAARNEAQHIAACIQSIMEMNYPAGQVHIYFGDDGSEDETVSIAKKAINGDTRFHIVAIPQDVNHGGKARVLEELSLYVQTEFIYILDADTQIGPKVFLGLLPYMEDKTAVVSGVTVIGDGGFQDLDWRFYSTILQGAANLHIPGTAVGNNMLIRTKALEAIGGFKSVPFSVTEDYALFRTFISKGWSWANSFKPVVVNYTFPAPDLQTLIRQRKRWTTGGLDFPWYWVLCFSIFGIYPWILLLAFIFSPILGICLMLSRGFIHTIIQLSLSRTHHFKTGWVHLMLYEIYLPLQLLLQSFSMLTPGVVWKNRKY